MFIINDLHSNPVYLYSFSISFSETGIFFFLLLIFQDHTSSADFFEGGGRTKKK